MVAQYKSPKLYLHSRLQVILDGKPSFDTGGVRRQVYSSCYETFAHNRAVRLFDGPENHLRPVCTAEARSSGLFKILGTMIAFVKMELFPYLSPTCYWYMVGGGESYYRSWRLCYDRYVISTCVSLVLSRFFLEGGDYMLLFT